MLSFLTAPITFEGFVGLLRAWHAQLRARMAPLRARWARAKRQLRQPRMLFPTNYLLFVAVASMDILCTWTILSLGGREVNPVADMVIQSYDRFGIVAFKFAFVVLIILACEWVGRAAPAKGLWLSRTAVAMTAFPVLVGLCELYAFDPSGT